MTARQTAVAAAGFALQRYQRSTQAFDDAVGRGLGLGPTDMRCLDHLSVGPLTAGALSDAVGLRPAATTALVDRLAARGILERRPAGSDRRKVEVALTSAGEAMVTRAYGPLVAEGAAVFDDMSPSEIVTLAALLDRMTTLTDAHTTRVTSTTAHL